MTYINRDLGTIGVLDGGIIALNPLIVNKLGCVLVGLSVSGQFRGCQDSGLYVPVRQLFPTPPGGKKYGKCQQIWHVTPKAWQLICDFFHGRRNSGVECLFEERDRPAPRTTTWNSRLAAS